MMEETTLRLAAARRKLTKATISEYSKLNVRTIDKIYDDIPDDVIVSNLRRVADALGLVLVVRFEEPADQQTA